MKFGQALEHAKKGEKISRSGWNGKDMYVYLVKGTTVPRTALRNEADKNIGYTQDMVTINPHLDMKAADGSIVVGWLASQTDMLAEDWEIIE